MVTPGNVTKYAVLHQYVYYTNMNNIYDMLAYNGSSEKFFFWFNSYINSQQSVEFTAGKMEKFINKARTRRCL